MAAALRAATPSSGTSATTATTATTSATPSSVYTPPSVSNSHLAGAYSAPAAAAVAPSHPPAAASAISDNAQADSATASAVQPADHSRDLNELLALLKRMNPELVAPLSPPSPSQDASAIPERWRRLFGSIKADGVTSDSVEVMPWMHAALDFSRTLPSNFEALNRLQSTTSSFKIDSLFLQEPNGTTNAALKKQFALLADVPTIVPPLTPSLGEPKHKKIATALEHATQMALNDLTRSIVMYEQAISALDAIASAASTDPATAAVNQLVFSTVAFVDAFALSAAAQIRLQASTVVELHRLRLLCYEKGEALLGIKNPSSGPSFAALSPAQLAVLNPPTAAAGTSTVSFASASTPLGATPTITAMGTALVPPIAATANTAGSRRSPFPVTTAAGPAPIDETTARKIAAALVQYGLVGTPSATQTMPASAAPAVSQQGTASLLPTPTASPGFVAGAPPFTPARHTAGSEQTTTRRPSLPQ